METIGLLSFCVIVIVVISITLGIVKQQLKQNKQDFNEGEKIDEIINNNSNLSDDAWNKWLQERGNKQK